MTQLSSGNITEAIIEANQQKKSPPAAEGLPEAQLSELLDNHDKLRNLAKSKLIEIIAMSKATTQLVPAIKELLDRIDGKPAQSINMKALVDNQLTVNVRIVKPNEPLVIDNGS